MVAEHGGRRKKKRGRGTPLERAAEQVHATNNPHDKPPPGTATAEAAPEQRSLSPDLLYQRERAYARAAADNFERWLVYHVAAERIQMDSVMRVVELIVIFVECMLLARVKWPDLYTSDDVEDDWTPQTASEAAACGLYVKPPKRDRLLAPTLPGCQGGAGHCQRLRRYGEKYCPACRAVEVRRMREQA